MLLNKTLSALLGIVIVLICWFFLSTDSSYQLAFKAKFYYQMQDFKKAYDFSQKAYELDRYNRLAMTLLRQSKDALRISEYLGLGDEYMAKIRAMASTFVSGADRERIRLMCEIMIDDFSRLKDVKGTNLYERATQMMSDFKRLKDELFNDESV